MSSSSVTDSVDQQSSAIGGGHEKYIIRIGKRIEVTTNSTEEEKLSNHDETAIPPSSSPKLATVSDASSSLPLLDLSLQEEIKAGTAVVRSLAHFEILDSQLREEILGSPTASVGEDGTFLGPLPRRKTGDRYRSLATPLEEFLDSIMRIPTAVRSNALVTFLTAHETQFVDSDHEPHMYHDYLLPCNNMHAESTPLVPQFHTIPRLRPFVYSVKTLPPGWWVVWQFNVEAGTGASLSHGSQVEFSVYVDQPSVDAKSEEEKATSGNVDISVEGTVDTSLSSQSCRWRELVHREICASASEQPFTGSYRFSPDVSDAASVSLQFGNVGKLSLLGGARVQVQCAAVPHEAFRAACEAAREQTDADARRSRAPLLYAILYSTEQEKEGSGIHFVVESFHDQQPPPANTSPRQIVFEREEEPEPARDIPNRIAEKDEELKKLRAEVEKLHKDRDYIREELSRINKLADDGKRKLQLMVSEKRVWSVARGEIQTELSRLSLELASERQEKTELTTQLEATKREVQQLHGEVKFLENTAPTEEDEHRQKEIMENAQSSVNDMRGTVAELESKLESLESRNAKLEATLEKQKKVNKERLGRAKAEVDESKMYQRVLEGKVRHLEQELRRKKEGQPSRKKVSKAHTKGLARSALCRNLDPKVASFEHPDERLNKQLNSLRSRHAKLVVLLKQNPNNEQNMELIGKIEKTIHDVVANAVKMKPSPQIHHAER